MSDSIIPQIPSIPTTAEPVPGTSASSSFSRALAVSVLIFAVSLTIGWIGTTQNPEIGEQLLSAFEKDVAGHIAGNNSLEVFTKLFFNNFEACILLFLGGASLGILTIFILSLNGVVIGSILEIVAKGHSPAFVAAAIVPHGIFEIPAFIISCALGILLSQALLGEWFGNADAADIGKRLGLAFIVFVIPLVITAAYVEAFITPLVIQLVS
ncbi:MAG: stage II sporulation protein M [Methanoregula sp.]|jgi:stage II sporulation protein M|nr:stage II sporulation protein M [Methanoregula sp.]